MSDKHPALHNPFAPGTALRVAFFVLGYMALDWTSYIAPIRGLNLTAWNPAPALGLLFVLQSGRAVLPALFAALVLSDVFIRNTPGNLATTLAVDGILTCGYAAIAHFLGRHFPEGGVFADRRGLLVWSLIVILGALLNGGMFVTALSFAGLLSPEEWGEALFRFWIGDAVGIYVSMPLFWWLAVPWRRSLFLANLGRLESLAYLGLAAATIWIAFIYGAQANFRYFYLLFLPVVWAASRQGLAGAVLSASALQVGMLLVGSLMPNEGVGLFEVQMRAFLIALVAFLIGVAVDDSRRALADLRQSLRLAAAGEMAAALAHELNQPLTALSALGSACELILKDPSRKDHAQLEQIVPCMVSEADRAAKVVIRLRDFFRSGAIHMETMRLAELLESVLAPFREKARGAGIELVSGAIPAEVVLVGDRLQLEVVLRNMLANAFDAVGALRAGPRRVSLTLRQEPANRLSILVEDSGPGPAGGIAAQIFEPFVSDKSSGLGLGLAISRAIAEAHGGTLACEFCDHGRFRLTLPLETA